MPFCNHFLECLQKISFECDEGLENKSKDNTKAASRDNHRLWCYKQHYASFDPMCDIIFATVRTSAKMSTSKALSSKMWQNNTLRDKPIQNIVNYQKSQQKCFTLWHFSKKSANVYLCKKVFKSSGEVIDFSHVLMLCVDKKSVWRSVFAFVSPVCSFPPSK